MKYSVVIAFENYTYTNKRLVCRIILFNIQGELIY